MLRAFINSVQSREISALAGEKRISASLSLRREVRGLRANISFSRQFSCCKRKISSSSSAMRASAARRGGLVCWVGVHGPGYFTFVTRITRPELASVMSQLVPTG